MNPLSVKVLVIGGMVWLLASIASFTLLVLPVENQIAQLQGQIKNAKSERWHAEETLRTLEKNNQSLAQQLSQVAPFDLRHEDDPESLL
ncbi:MAG: hypothetical protein HY692_04840, partial [Cyanobacteria bacterium NC_groundwater_1444_Ag_S-0.65um_54_12]|nr:hypothetical protein [Cyanobacteria bacterium NC_groundwater_1444_Ag_S-0.65um_54_12]